MFKFATNKFNVGGGGGGGSNANSSGNNTSQSQQRSEESGSSSSQASRRRLLQKDLFAFNKIADKGFPSKPSAMDYDRKLKLLALGTKSGDIRIYGAPGTQQQQLSCYQDVHPFPIQRILFIQGQHQLITLSERVHRNDQTNKGESLLYLVLWQIPSEQKLQQSNLVEKIKEYQLDPKAINGSKLSAMTLLNDNSHLFLGFESGDVYVFNVSAFQLVPGVINKDYILKNLPESTTNKRLASLGAVESICHHPRQLTKLLLAYQRGLWVIFDFIKNQIDQINQTSQQLESAVFYQAGECVATAHSDGSFILWDLETNLNSSTAATSTNNSPTNNPTSTIPSCASNSAPNIVYGPYPCKPVQKCLVKTCRNDQPYVIFSGGCPRVNYSDKVTISVIQGENSHVCFDFTSKIIDYFTIDKPTIEKPSVTYDNPQALFVLLEEEFVAIDLTSEGWPQYKLPYLYSVHSSAIICTHYVSGVTRKFYEALKFYGGLSETHEPIAFSENEWPVGGSAGSPVSQASKGKDLLLTGHEDGTIRFWDVTQMSMTLLYQLKTSDYFQTESTPLDDDPDMSCDNNGNNGNEDNWPPFRKVGTFDPYSDDPKLGIQKLYLCPSREVLCVAGTAGQVLIMSINEQAKEMPASELRTNKINLIGVSPEVESHFVWKGHEPLASRQASATIKLQPGYQLQSLIQLYPPATISALALNTDWQLVAMGTSHGFALFDYNHIKPLLIRCTLDPAMLNQQNPNDSGGNMISRRKSLKKSLRESFRKLRRGRSQKNPNSSRAHNPNATMLTRLNQIPNSSQMRVEHMDEDDIGAHKPIERQVESREFKPMDDIPPSVIRYMYFVRTFITSSQQQTNSLWVGTNTGIIYIYALQFQGQQQLPHMPAIKTRTNQIVNCLLAKEMRLKHRAPVVHIQVIDQNMQPLPISNDSNKSQQQQQQPQDMTTNTNHKVIICSEEQFKVFQLPALKPVCKFKLTAVEGARVRRIGYNAYTSRSDPKYSEYCLSCLSNLGDLSVYSLPQLKRQVQIQCMKQQDINAITSFVFSKQGQAFYLQSPSEFVHISMSARDSPQQLALITNTKQPVPANRNASPKKSAANKSSSGQNNSQRVAKQQQQEGTQSAMEASTTSPKSPSPPVPAPRTTVNKEQEQAASSSRSSNPLKKQDSFDNANINSSKQQQSSLDAKPLNKEPITMSTSSLKPTNNNNNTSGMQHSTPSAKQTMSIDASPIRPSASSAQSSASGSEASEGAKRTQSESISNNESKIEDTTADQSKEDESKQQSKETTPSSNLNNISEVINASSTTTSGVSLGSAFNQSSISSSTVSQTSHQQKQSAHNNHQLNNNSISMITTAQNDSFNVSSSGYNGSSSYAGVDLSMDSVVDRFNDEFHDLSTRKIQPAINENDSLLNESSHALDASRINLNGDSANKSHKTSTLNNQAQGNVNYTFTTDSPSAPTGTDSQHQSAQSKIPLPKTASSPLTKLNHNNPRPMSNKNEQVTKRIVENSNKSQEYRETVID